MDRDGLDIDCGTAFGHRMPGAGYSCNPRPNETARRDGVESMTTCKAGGLDFRPLAEKTKKDGSTFCVELATGCKAPGF